MSDPSLIRVVVGDDPVLRSDVTARLVHELLAGEDRGFALDDIEIPKKRGADADADDSGPDDADDLDAGPDLSLVERILVALSSPPFLTARRVVVIRNYRELGKDQATMVAERLADPTPNVFVVLERHGGRDGPIDALAKKQKFDRLAPESETIGGGSKKTSVVEVELQRWLDEKGVKLASDARRAVIEHLGDEAARVHELVETLASRFPVGATVRADDVEPYLGAAGALGSPFALTTAIESGDTANALATLHRLMHAAGTKSSGNRPNHPIQLLAVLVSYYRSLLKLDDPDINSRDDAAAALGGNPWAAGYRLDAFRRAGPDGVSRAIALLAQADLDLRGAGGTRAIDEETVMQVLVARLCAIHAGGNRPRRPEKVNR